MFFNLLRRIIRQGTLRLIMAGGKTHELGTGAPHVTLRLHRRMPGWAFALRPDLKIAQAYRDGALTIEQGSLRDFFYILTVNYQQARKQPLFALLEKTNGRARQNEIATSQLIQQVYGFLPETKCRQQRLEKKWPRGAQFLFAKPWLKLFHIRLSWGGLRLPVPRKRQGIARLGSVALSLAQYRNSRQNARGDIQTTAFRFKPRTAQQTVGFVIAVKNQRRHYSGTLKILAVQIQKHKTRMVSLFDQCFFGPQHLRLVRKESTFGHRGVKTVRIHFGMHAPIMPWSRDYMFDWERANCARSDNFVRQETS